MATIGAVAPIGDRDLTLVWMDLELTGLNSNAGGDTILEAAIAVTGSVPALETPVREFVIWQPEPVLARMSPAVRQMHTLNGLIDRVRLSTQTLAEVEGELLKIVAGSCPPGEAILAGNSVWVDRKFLAMHMPAVERYLHYRQVDVSSLKVLAGAWFGERARFDKDDSHTAAGDVRASMAELLFYRSLFGAP
jgi:oligoribonuclease